jgi:hypothetical protein
MMIHIDGPLQKPELRKEPLPGVNHVLQQITGGK